MSELLRRISLGVGENAQANDNQTLVLCYELFQEAMPGAEKVLEASITNSRPPRDESYFLVQNNPRSVVKKYPENLGLLARLAFDILNSVLVRNRELLNATTLKSFMPILYLI